MKKPSSLSYFSIVAAGVFLSTMDSSMINIALPHIMSSFSATFDDVQWVVIIYLLIISSSLLLFGRISDTRGKGIIYITGVFLFSTGALLCFFSTKLSYLIFSRCVQGCGASMMMSTGPAIIRFVVPSESIGKWLGNLGIATSMGLMTGPLLGGVLLEYFGWRILFLINLPVSMCIILIGSRYLIGKLPKNPKQNDSGDLKGSVFWVIIVSCLVVLLSNDLISSVMYKLVVFFFLAAMIFLFHRHERRLSSPLFPLQLVLEKYFSIALITATLSFAVLFFVLILLPFYLKYVSELNYQTIGLVMMSVPVSLIIVSPIAGRLFDRYGARYLTASGMFITATAIVLISFLSDDSTLVDICWRLMLLGAGQSIFLSPNTASVLSRVDFNQTGVSAGLLATCRNLGMLIGVALVGLIFSQIYLSYSAGQNLKDFNSSDIPFFLYSFQLTLFVAASIAFINGLISLMRK